MNKLVAVLAVFVAAFLTCGAGIRGLPNTSASLVYFTGNNNLPVGDAAAGGVLGFTNSNDACDYFGNGAGECIAAEDYFSGYSGPPTTMWFTRLPQGGSRPRIFGAPIQNSLSALQAACTASNPCPIGLIYNVDSNVAPNGYPISTTFCADTTSTCLPAPETISSAPTASGGSVTLSWTGAASPVPAGDGFVTISGATPSSLNGTYQVTDASPTSVTITSSVTTGFASGGTITFNPSLNQVASNVNDALNNYIFANPTAKTTGGSITNEHCLLTGYVGFHFLYVQSTNSCSLPIGAAVNTTTTGIVVMAQNTGPGCAPVNGQPAASCASSGGAQACTIGSTGCNGCAPINTAGCVAGGAGQYVVWTTGECCLNWQPGPSNSTSVQNPTLAFTAYWTQWNVVSNNSGTIATGEALEANLTTTYLFGGDGVGCTVSHAYCVVTSVNSNPGTGIMSYISGGTVAQTPTGTSCTSTGCNGTAWVLSCGFASPGICGSSATGLNPISLPIQVTYKTFTGPDGTTGRLIIEPTSWGGYDYPFMSMNFMTGYGAQLLGISAGATGIASGGQNWGNFITLHSHSMPSYVGFLQNFYQNVFPQFGYFQIANDPDAGYQIPVQQNLIQAWATANGINYIQNFHSKVWALTNWPPPACTPGTQTFTSGSGSRAARYCRVLTVTATGPSGSTDGSFYGGTGASTTITDLTTYSDEYAAPYSVGAAGSGNPTTFTVPNTIQTNNGQVSVAAGANATASANGAGGAANSGDDGFGGIYTGTGWAPESSTAGVSGGATGGSANGSVSFTSSN